MVVRTRLNVTLYIHYRCYYSCIIFFRTTRLLCKISKIITCLPFVSVFLINTCSFIPPKAVTQYIDTQNAYRYLIFLPIFRIGLSILIEVPVFPFCISLISVYQPCYGFNLCRKTAAQFVERNEQEIIYR
jgi:hypothetical protein